MESCRLVFRVQLAVAKKVLKSIKGIGRYIIGLYPVPLPKNLFTNPCLKGRIISCSSVGFIQEHSSKGFNYVRLCDNARFFNISKLCILTRSALVVELLLIWKRLKKRFKLLRKLLQ